MKKFYLFFLIPAILLSSFNCAGQDFSNKGKDFWVIYTGHIDGTTSRMALYITSTQNATGTVSVAGNVINFTVTANQVTTIRLTNSSTPSNSVAYNSQTVGIGANKGIHILTDNPVVVYAHILNSARSGSTLVLPTNVLGREYYVSSYRSAGGAGNTRRSEFALVASEDNTTVEITPTVADANNTYAANAPFQVVLNKGDVFQFQSADGNDLTGTYIKSVATPTSPCKPIAVFAGSTWTAMGCTNASSGDNLYQQLFPLVSWGKEYITAPFILRSFDVFRVLVRDPTTVVRVNGVALSLATLISNSYYEFNTSGSNTPRIITSDKPICVVQYMITSNCDGVLSDPEMIILNAVEQTLSDITVLSARNDLTPPATNITRHFLNIIIKTSALSSLKIDGAAYTSTPIAINSTPYSYLQEEVTNSTNVNPAHRITSDSGFLAIAYGYGMVESYGYNAGTNVRDLYQFVTLQNQYATVNFPTACKNSPFYFYMTFPYQPTQIKWAFNGLFPDVTVNSPVFDSTWLVNGRQLYRYKLPLSYTITAIGTYPVKVIAQNPTPDGCSGEQQIDYDIQVFDPPSAQFTFTSTGCLSDTVYFSDNTGTAGRAVSRYWWDFGDGNTGTIKNPKEKYLVAGSYTVKHALITDVGCLSDTAKTVLDINDPPVAKFSIITPYCMGKSVTFTDESTIATGAIAKWYWNFGDGSPQVIATSSAPATHIYNGTGTFTATLKVESSGGCQSILFSKQVTISSNPVAIFDLPNVCLPAGTAQFNSTSTISDGTQSQFIYQWNFGDGGTAATQNPVHVYSSAGPFNVTLKVTSNNGCEDDSVRVLNTIYAQPIATFTAPSEVCYGTIANFTDQSTAPNSTVGQWLWNFGDGTTSTQQSPSKTYSAPGSYSVTLTITSAIGCQSATATKTVIVNSLPVANFNVSSPTCVTRDITFTDVSSANSGTLVKWTWDYGDGANAVLNNGNSFTHTFINTGSYNITLQVQTDKGCISTITTKQVVVNTLPNAGFISPEVCLTDPLAPFIDTSSITSGTIAAWDWNFGDANATPANPNTAAIKNPSHRYSITGNFTARLIVTSDKGCKDTVSQTFIVNGSVPAANFTVQNSNALCSNNDIVITDASTVDFGNIVKVEIYWDYANNPTIKTIEDYPQPGKTYSHLYPEFGIPATKTYSVRMVSYSGINCLNVITKTITVLATPSIQFDPVGSICKDVPAFQVTQAIVVNGLQGAGTFSGQGISQTGLFDPNIAGTGIHTVRYTFNGANGCSNYKEQIIQVFPVPTVNAGPDRFMLDGGSINLAGSASGNGVTYLWIPNLAMDNNTLPNPKVSPPDDTYYTLNVTSRDGCKASDVVFVKVLKAPVIPNVFSPNGDGINDTWEITSLSSYPGSTVEIFNRYGQLIFRSAGYNKPWDGTFKGKAVPAGTYYYIVDPKNGRKQIAGFVDVLR